MVVLNSVSVVVPHYGDPALALSLINDLKRQDYSGSIQIIVVDDRSPIPFPITDGVQVLRHQVNSGFGTAVNTGAGSATGDLLFILNSDLHVDPDFISSMVSAAAPLQPAIVSPRVEYASGESQWEVRRYPNVLTDFFEWFTPIARYKSGLRWHRMVGHVPYSGNTPVRGDWLIGAALVLPLAEFQKVGGFDQDFFMYCEEVDLQRRLASNGVYAYLIPTARVEHDGAASSPNETRRGWMVRSRFMLQRKMGKSLVALQATFTTATLLNFAANLLRLVFNRDVKPMQILKLELELISKSR